MRTPLAFAIAFSMTWGCATHDHQRNLSGYSPPVIITLRSVQVTNDCHIASFEMKNVGDVDMWFDGNKRGDADYFVQRQVSIDGWEGETDDGGDCGMDRGFWRVAAGTSTTFRAYLRPRQQRPVRYRVGVRLYPSEFPTESTPRVIYWSEPISL